MVTLVEIEAYDPNAPEGEEAVTLLWSSLYTLFAADDPTMPNGEYSPCLSRKPFELEQRMYGKGPAPFGPSIPSHGTLVIGNGGEHDYLLDLEFVGRPVSVYLGEHGKPRADFVKQFTGTFAKSPSDNAGKMTFYPTEEGLALKEPMQTETYEGTSTTTGSGVEGGDSEKGQTKPVLFGTVPDAEGVSVNGPDLIRQWSSLGPNGGVVELRDNGVALKHFGDITDNNFDDAAGTVTGIPYQYLNDDGNGGPVPSMQEWPQMPGGYVTDVKGSGLWARLGGNPVGEIRADVKGLLDGPNGLISSHVQMISWAALGAGEMIRVSAFAAAQAADPAPAGIHLTSSTTYRAFIDKIAASAGLWWGYTPDGEIELAKYKVPALTADVDINQAIIDTLKELKRREPWWRRRLTWGGERSTEAAGATDLGGGTVGDGGGTTGTALDPLRPRPLNDRPVGRLQPGGRPPDLFVDYAGGPTPVIGAIQIGVNGTAGIIPAGTLFRFASDEVTSYTVRGDFNTPGMMQINPPLVAVPPDDTTIYYRRQVFENEESVTPVTGGGGIVESADETVLDVYKGAQDVGPGTSLYAEEDGALAEATRQRTEVFDRPHAPYEILCAPEEPELIRIGKTISVTWPRYGLENGALLMVEGVKQEGAFLRIWAWRKR